MNKKLISVLAVVILLFATGVMAQTTIHQPEGEEVVYELGERTLRIGDKGEDVADLQAILNETGDREGRVDGVFGPLTHGSVLRFQKANELEADGLVAGKTMQLLLEINGKKAEEAAQKEQKAAAFSTMAVELAADEFNFTAAEMDLFARIVHAESAGESYQGQVAVASTILNRIRSDRFPDTMSGVVYQVEGGKYQYSPVLDGRINLPAGEGAKNAVRDALNGADPTGGATGFYNPAKTANAWVRSQPVTTVIGSHVFFR